MINGTDGRGLLPAFAGHAPNIKYRSTTNSTKVYYSNNLRIGIKQLPIITVIPLDLNISCGYNLMDQTTLNIPLNVTKCSKTQFQDYTPKTVISESSSFISTTMSIYLDPEYSTPLGGNDVSVVTDLYLSLFSHYVDEEQFVLRVQKCIATPDGDITNDNKMQLVSGGCPADQGVYVKILQNGISFESRFQFKAFAFNGFPLVFITCDVSYCIKYENCIMQCDESSLKTQEPSLKLPGEDTVCYSGSDYITCESKPCVGVCDVVNGCLCRDRTLCIPTSECVMNSNVCCPPGLFWDGVKLCCTETPLCSPPCYSDEVCTYASGVTTCACNESLYKDKTVADLAPLLVCNADMVISVSTCLLKFLGYDYTTMHINDKSNACTLFYSDVINGQYMYSLKLLNQEGWCGNIVTHNSSMVYYTNGLHIDIQKGNLITANPLSFNFTCAYNLIQEKNKSEFSFSNGTDFALNEDLCTNISCCTINLPAITGHSTYNYNISMAAYIDEQFNSPLTDELATDFYVGMFAEADRNNFSLSVEQCIVSPTNNRNSNSSVVLITGG
ncbi:uncharacterized protein LOC142741821 [Rhinoderma darwinii]|uniref:uncharacterized protein LOC142741821 n=1 Tax=Rhinoderma darwinii TaxID=43563 RepID=UPI003F67DEA9